MPRQSSNLDTYFSQAEQRTGVPARDYKSIFQELGIQVVTGDTLGMHFVHPLRGRDRHLSEHTLDQRIGAYHTIDTNLNARFDAQRVGATLDLLESKTSVLPDEFLAKSAERAFDRSLRAKDLPLAERCLHEAFYDADKYWEGAEKVVSAYMKADKYADMLRAAKGFGYEPLELEGLKMKAVKRLLYEKGKPVKLNAVREERVRRLVAELGDSALKGWVYTYASRVVGNRRRGQQLALERRRHGMEH
jgi:hypothetical protein